MLTRRQLLTTVATTPLATFCKTEPVRPWSVGHRHSAAECIEFLERNRDPRSTELFNLWVSRFVDAIEKKTSTTDSLRELPPTKILC